MLTDFRVGFFPQTHTGKSGGQTVVNEWSQEELKRILYQYGEERYAFFPQTHTGKSGGQVQPFTKVPKPFFTIRSSREWKVRIAEKL